jgi:hypothetical protein
VLNHGKIVSRGMESLSFEGSNEAEEELSFRGRAKGRVELVKPSSEGTNEVRRA